MIKIGTCGYSYYKPGQGWKEQYESKLQAFSDSFSHLELNKTFYKLPMVKTASRWRNEVSSDFEFSVKAWQAITHPVSSPTWNNRRDGLNDEQREQFGYFTEDAEYMGNNAQSDSNDRFKRLRYFTA